MTDQTTASAALYHRSTWQKEIDDNKMDMGLMAPLTQDQLDHDMVRAVVEHHHRGLREMVQLGANPNRMLLAPVQGTALHLAAAQGTLKTVVTLLQMGADPFLRDPAGLTPRDIVTQTRRAGAGRIRTVLKLWEQRNHGQPLRVVGESEGRGARSGG